MITSVEASYHVINVHVKAGKTYNAAPPPIVFTKGGSEFKRISFLRPASGSSS